MPIVCAGEHCVARSRPSGSRRDVLIVASRALPPSRLPPSASRTDGASSWGGGLDIQGFRGGFGFEEGRRCGSEELLLERV